MGFGSCTRCYNNNGDTSKGNEAFLAQVAGSSNKGPRSLIHYRTDRNTQIHVAKACVVEFAARQEARDENNNPQMIVLGSGVKHRPSKMKGV